MAYGFIGDMQQKYLVTCQANPSQSECQLINKGIAAQRVAAAALNDYCSGPPKAGDAEYMKGGPCSEQSGLAPRLQVALTNLNSIMSDIKKLKGSK